MAEENVEIECWTGNYGEKIEYCKNIGDVVRDVVDMDDYDSPY